MVRYLLGPAWRRDWGISTGDAVTVVLAPEGPSEKSLFPTLPPPSGRGARTTGRLAPAATVGYDRHGG
jgi:hypothetical protein